MNIPDGWMVYPLLEVTIAAFAIAIISLIVQIKILKELKSFRQPEQQTNDPKKETMSRLTFKDMR